LSEGEPRLSAFVESAAGPLAGELQEMLQARNGFYAFYGALHVFPITSSDLSWGLEDWNMPGLWKHEYEAFVDPGLCFAQDIFANQFTIKDGTVHFFQAETGDLTPMAATLAKWAELILADDRRWTEWPTAYRWQNLHGPIPLHHRLQPAIPFVCRESGEFTSLAAIEAGLLMSFGGYFAGQIRDLPDGAKIKFEFPDE
jgi:hypothetical protein